jgi:hypothetical protein
VAHVTALQTSRRGLPYVLAAYLAGTIAVLATLTFAREDRAVIAGLVVSAAILGIQLLPDHTRYRPWRRVPFVKRITRHTASARREAAIVEHLRDHLLVTILREELFALDEFLVLLSRRVNDLAPHPEDEATLRAYEIRIEEARYTVDRLAAEIYRATRPATYEEWLTFESRLRHLRFELLRIRAELVRLALFIGVNRQP